MSKLILPNTVLEQTSAVVSLANALLIKLAYDGRSRIKIRFRKEEKSENTYVIEVKCEETVIQDTIHLDFNPFNVYWLFVKSNIQKHLSIPHCKKSRYGGYTFYN